MVAGALSDPRIEELEAIARALIAACEFSEAQRVLTIVIAARPDAVRALLLYAVCASRTGAVDEATRIVERIQHSVLDRLPAGDTQSQLAAALANCRRWLPGGSASSERRTELKHAAG